MKHVGNVGCPAYYLISLMANKEIDFRLRRLCNYGCNNYTAVITQWWTTARIPMARADPSLIGGPVHHTNLFIIQIRNDKPPAMVRRYLQLRRHFLCGINLFIYFILMLLLYCAHSLCACWNTFICGNSYVVIRHLFKYVPVTLLYTELHTASRCDNGFVRRVLSTRDATGS